MATIIDDLLKAHNKDGYLIVVSDGSVKHMHQMNFGLVLSTAGGVHLATSYGECDGRGSSLPSRSSRNAIHFTFHSTTSKIQHTHQHQNHLCI